MLIALVLRDKGADVHTLPASATLQQAAEELLTRRVGALVVVDAEGALIGVFSERDLVREVARRGTVALSTEIGVSMTRNVITAHPNETIDDCLSRMTDRRIRHLPVIDEQGLAGIVSIGDLVKHRIAAAEAESAAMQAYITAH